jgi:hypothetical protein
MHPNIRKSEQDNNVCEGSVFSLILLEVPLLKSSSFLQDCPWLLRSPVTSEYDILSVTGDWTVWAGKLFFYTSMTWTFFVLMTKYYLGAF